MSEQIYSSAVIYLRVSTKEQAQKGGEAEGYSIPAQRAACLKKAEALGIKVIDEFVDAGESAKTSARPQLPQAVPRRGVHSESAEITEPAKKRRAQRQTRRNSPSRFSLRPSRLHGL